MSTNMPMIGQGPSRLANNEELARDAVGFTNLNLHRRISKTPTLKSYEYNKNYKLGIYGHNSYLTTESVTHDEDSSLDEIP